MTLYFEGKGWRVTDSLVRSPKRTFTIDRIEAVSLRRILFLVCTIPAAGAFLIVALFGQYLFAHEIITLICIPGIALVISYQFGVLTVETLALRDQEGGVVYGWFSQLEKARSGIEEALEANRTNTPGVLK